MEKEEILKYLHIVNDKLHIRNVKGEICLYGGAVMCLVYDARPSTKDVDAIFHPANVIREIAKEIRIEYNLDKNWLNDGVKGFLVEHPRKVFQNLSNLTIMVADAEYILSMKALASRFDTMDKQDLMFFIKELNLACAEDVFQIVEKYYPKRQIKPATQFFLEELFDEMQNR